MKEFISDRLVFISLSVSLIINIILWALLVGKFGLSGEPIPLHFNVIAGIDFVGPAWKIYQIPLAGLAIMFINSALAYKLIFRDLLFSYFLTFSSAFIQAILLIGAAALIFVNNA